jgi:hypothetical protein
MTLCSPRFLFRLFTPLWMVSMWISVNFRMNPFMHEVNDSSICLRIYSIDAIMQSKRQNIIQTTRPTLNRLARLPSWNDHSLSGTRQWILNNLNVTSYIYIISSSRLWFCKVKDYDFYVTITDGHVTIWSSDHLSDQITDADEACRSSEISVNLIIIIVFFVDL